ncbi:MAG: FUSC family protein [Gaiellales bacterium]
MAQPAPTSPPTTLPLRKVMPFALLLLAVGGTPILLSNLIVGTDYIIAAIAGVSLALLGVALIGGVRGGLFAVGVAAAAAAVSVAVAPWPLAGAVWLGACGAAVGLSGLRGWIGWTPLVAIWCAYLVVTPPQVGFAAMFQGEQIPFSLQACVETALVVVACGVPIIFVTPQLLRRMPSVPTVPPLPKNAAVLMAACLGLLLLVEAAVVLQAFRVPAAHWLLLTTLVVAQPSTDRMLRRGIHRAIGTVAGACIAATVVIVGTNQGVRMAIGFALLYGSFVLLLSARPYWMYATLLTPAVILLSEGTTSGLDVTAARLGFTLLGILLAFGVMVIVSLAEHRRPASGCATG